MNDKANEKQAAGKQSADDSGTPRARRDWPLWEVFVRSRGGLNHKHVGSVHASDGRMAINHARDTYTRRMEGVSLWVMRSSDIVASDPAHADELFGPAEDKVYRHPTFYDIPDDVRYM